MKKYISMLAGVAMVGLVAGNAQAATISDSFTNPLTTTEINQVGTLDLFDPNLGTLTGVQFNFDGSAQTIITLTNNASTAQNVSATGSVELYLSSTNLALNALFGNPVISLSMPTGVQAIAGNGIYVSPLLIDSDSGGYGVANLAAFIGPGTFSVTCTSLSGITLVGGGGNIGSDQETSARCGAEIIYTYSTTPNGEVPEPASMLLLGSGLLGLAARARRRKEQ